MRETAKNNRPRLDITEMYFIPWNEWPSLLNQYLSKADALAAYFPGDGDMAYGFAIIADLSEAVIEDWNGMIGVSGKKVTMPVNEELRQAIPSLVHCPKCHETLWSFELIADDDVIFRIDDYDVCTARQIDNLLDTTKFSKAYQPA